MTLRRRLGLAGLTLGVTAVAVFGLLAPPERCPDVDESRLRRGATEAVDWFVRNQLGDGTWLYLYEPDTDTVVPDYNEIRHSGAIMGLYQAAKADIPGALESGDKGLEWSVDRLHRHDGWAAVRYKGQTTAGGAALLAAGLAERRAASGDDEHDELLESLGQFLVAQTEPSGAVLAYYSVADEAPVPGLYSKYYTGEAYWALAMLAEQFPDGPYGETADRIGHYLATQRDEDEDVWPPIPDHWAAYGMAETAAQRPLSQDEVDYARRQAGSFGAQVRWVSQRHGPWGLLVRGPMTPRGGGYGVVGEALGGWWRAARAAPQLADLEAPLAERTRCIAGLALVAQSSPAEAADFPDPDRVRGAWFHRDETRMDDQQHALSALLATMEIEEVASADRDGGPPTRPAPSFWLWLVVLFAAFNPFRVGLSLPREGRSRTDLVRLAALGGAIGSLGVFLVSLTSGPVLDLLDVSRPALRIGAATIGAMAGAVALFRPPTVPEPVLSGRRAALVPVALPLVAAPALILLALSADADRGFWPVLVALVLATLKLAGVAFIEPEGAWPVVLRWLGRLLAGVLVAGSILLIVDGVFAV